MAGPAPKYAQETRLRFLDGLLFWEGRANRRDLMAEFQISPAQVTIDFREYLEAAGPERVSYDTKQKLYLATEAFTPIYGEPDISAWVKRSARAKAEQVDQVQPLARAIDGATMAELRRAIRDKRAIPILYTTFARGEEEPRWIAPTALASDGLRWHVRAYCFKRQDYRDFVVSRINRRVGKGRPAIEAAPSTEHLPQDIAWNRFIELDLIPAPHLNALQAAAVRHEYGLVAECLTVRLREALEFYALRRWRLDQSDSRMIVSERRVVTDGGSSTAISVEREGPGPS